MNKIKIFSIIFIVSFLSSNVVFAQRNFNVEFDVKAGNYLFNSNKLYFFDDGIDCYLTNVCNDIDTVFENTAVDFKVTKDTVIKAQSYMYTDNYEYMYVRLNKKEGWLRADIPLEKSEEVFLKRFLPSHVFDMLSCYVQIIPFKNNSCVFVSNADDWYIANIKRKKIEHIGTKGGRLEACQMLFSKNCVKCYIDMGWGQDVWFDENGKKIKQKPHH